MKAACALASSGATTKMSMSAGPFRALSCTWLGLGLGLGLELGLGLGLG